MWVMEGGKGREKVVVVVVGYGETASLMVALSSHSAVSIRRCHISWDIKARTHWRDESAAGQS